MRAILSLVLLTAGASFLVAADDPPKPTNELISDFIDNTNKYKGKTVTFKLAYGTGDSLVGLRERVGDKGVPFIGKDPKNDAKLILGVEIPKGLKVPAARSGEVVVITFECKDGKTNSGNVATSIVRP